MNEVIEKNTIKIIEGIHYKSMNQNRKKEEKKKGF